jgi:hypothetical protein
MAKEEHSSPVIAFTYCTLKTEMLEVALGSALWVTAPAL